MAKKKIKLSVHLTDREQIWGIAYLLISIFLLPEVLTWLNHQLPLPIGSAWLNFLYFTVNFLFILWIFHGYFKRSLGYAGSHVWDFLLAVLVGSAGYWLVNWGLSLLFGRFFPDYGNLNDSVISEMTHGNFWIMAAGTVVLVPVAEEALHRGLIFGCLYLKSHSAAYILSSIIFAAVHVMNYIGVYSLRDTVLAFIQYIPAGLALGWAYRKSGSIFAPMLIHASINAVGIWLSR